MKLNINFYIESLKKVSRKYKKAVYAIFNDGAIIYDRKNETKKIFGKVIEINEEQKK